MTWLGFSRSTEVPFEPEALRLIQMLLPHFRQGMRVAVVLAQERQQKRALGAIWSSGGRGVVIRSPGGALLFANEAAEAMAKQGILRLTGGRPSFRDARINDLLAANLGSLRAGVTEAASPAGLTVSADGAHYGVRFVPHLASPLEAAGSPLVVLLIPLAREAVPDPSEIAQFAGLFGLTRSEEGVLAAVVSGTELAAHARARGIALDSARKYLKSVLAKANCRSQKDLVRRPPRRGGRPARPRHAGDPDL